jgi:hypothetical protein
MTLFNDVARCQGVGYQEDDGWDWREGDGQQQAPAASSPPVTNG